MTLHRSPSYPYLTLEDALSLVENIYKQEKRHAVPVGVIVTHAGYKDTKSSSAKRTLGALAHFGLVDEDGASEDRKMKLSARSLDILLEEDANSPKRKKAIKDAGEAPAVHRRILAEFPEGLPSDGTLKQFLIRELDFNDSHVDTFITKFRKTVDFAGLYENNTPTPSGDDGVPPPPPAEGGKPGDSVLPNPPSPPSSDNIQVPPGFETSRWAFDEGPVLISWPAKLSKESVEELEDSIAVLMKRLKRKAGMVDNKPPVSNN